jgi:hypothetical protein
MMIFGFMAFLDLPTAIIFLVFALRRSSRRRRSIA